MLIVRVLLAIGLSSVFLVSAVPKMRHPRSFMLALIGYRVLPLTLSRLFALILPTLELWIALLFLAGTFVRLAALAYALLLLSFIIAISVNLRRGHDLNCHCFGSKSRRTIGAGLLLQDVLLGLSACLLAVLTPSWWGSEPWSFMQYTGLAPFVAFLISGTCSLILSIALGSSKVASSFMKFIPSSRKPVPIRTRTLHQGGSQ